MAENILTRLFKKREKDPQKVIVCGHELTLKYSLYAATFYERMTGNSALDLKQFQDNKLEPIVTLGYCMLQSDNDLKALGIDFEKYMADMDTIEKMTALVQAVSKELMNFYQPDKSQDQGKTEDAGKNA